MDNLSLYLLESDYIMITINIIITIITITIITSFHLFFPPVYLLKNISGMIK